MTQTLPLHLHLGKVRLAEEAATVVALRRSAGESGLIALPVHRSTFCPLESHYPPPAAPP